MPLFHIYPSYNYSVYSISVYLEGMGWRDFGMDLAWAWLAVKHGLEGGRGTGRQAEGMK